MLKILKLINSQSKHGFLKGKGHKWIVRENKTDGACLKVSTNHEGAYTGEEGVAKIIRNINKIKEINKFKKE